MNTRKVLCYTQFMLKRSQVINRLQAHRAELQSLGVKSLAVFGSVARDTASINSDVDLLVEFAYPIGLFQFIELQNYLEKTTKLPR
jgi:uncharacterized protein